MTVQASITSVGVKDALRELNRIDKVARRDLTREYKQIVEPLVSDAKSLVPRDAPLSGMNRSWTPKGSSAQVLPFTGATTSARPPKVGPTWQQSKEGRRQMGRWMQFQAGIKAYVSGKRPLTTGNYTRNLAAFGVRWQGPAAVLFDTSGQSSSPQGAQMVAALTARYGRPSRVMWRAYERADKKIQNEIEQLIKRLMDRVNGRLR